MKVFRVSALLALAALAASPAWATTLTDPQIIVNDPDCTVAADIFTLQFTFTTNSLGKGLFCFKNETGVNITTFQFIALEPPGTTFPNDFVCGGNAFINCTFQQSGGNIIINFFGLGGTFLGIPAGHEFTINLNSDLGGWVPDSTFTARANLVPEPGTIALLLTGAGALGTRRRVRQSLGLRT